MSAPRYVRIRAVITFIPGMDVRKLQPYAHDHHGVITLTHARQQGISKAAWYRAIRSGLLEPLHPGVARLVGARDSREQAIMAAVLAAGQDVLASHRSAAYLWGIPRPDHGPIDVVMKPRRRKVELDGVVAHRPRDKADLKRVLRSRIPTTNILRTLCDLGACDAPAVYGAVGHALSTGLASAGAIDRAVARHSERGRHGIVALRNALVDWQLDGKPADSVLEPSMRKLLCDFGLPPVQFHALVEGYEVDFRVIDTPVVIECDGWTTHGLDRRRFERDRERDADLLAAGYVTVRRTYRQIVQRRAETAGKIEAALRRWAPEVLATTS